MSKVYIGPFNKAWFAQHQKPLLRLLNNRLTKKLVRKSLWLHHEGPLDYIGPNYFTFNRKYVGGGRYQQTSKFHTFDIFSVRVYQCLAPVWWAMHFWDWLIADRWVPQLSFGFLTLSASPVAGTASPVDGSVACSDPSTYANCQAGTGTLSAETTTQNPAVSNFLSGNYNIRRYFLTMDSSALGSGAVISAADLSIRGSGNAGSEVDTGQMTLHAVSASLASTANVATTDFMNVGSTSFANVPYASFDINSYMIWNFNASGIAAINKTGISQFALRADGDLNNATPTGLNRQFVLTADGCAAFSVAFPALEVTYTIQGPFIPPDLPNPRGRIYPQHLRIFVSGIEVQLIGKDKFFGAPGEPPQYMNLWTINPRSRPFPIDLRSYIDPSEIWLRGKDIFFGAPGQPPQYHTPNPIPRPYPISLRTWTVAGVSSSVIPVLNSFLMNIESLVGGILQSFTKNIEAGITPLVSKIHNIESLFTVAPFGRGPTAIDINLESNTGLAKTSIENTESNVGLSKSSQENIEAKLIALTNYLENIESKISTSASKIPNTESLIGLNQTRQENIESLVGLSQARQENVESKTGLAPSYIENTESKVSLSVTKLENTEALIGVNQTRQEIIESLFGLAKACIENIESSGSLLVSNNIIPNIESLLGLNQQRQENTEGVVGLNQPRQENIESKISLNSSRVCNVESLIGVSKTAQELIEAVTGIARSPLVNYEAMAVGVLTSQIVINIESIKNLLNPYIENIEALIPLQNTKQINLESLTGTAAAKSPAIEALKGLAGIILINQESGGSILSTRFQNIESTSHILMTRVPNTENLFGLSEQIQEFIESGGSVMAGFVIKDEGLISIQKPILLNAETKITSLTQYIENIESKIVGLTSARSVNIESLLAGGIVQVHTALIEALTASSFGLPVINIESLGSKVPVILPPLTFEGTLATTLRFNGSATDLKFDLELPTLRAKILKPDNDLEYETELPTLRRPKK
jgi:hypothetical protein